MEINKYQTIVDNLTHWGKSFDKLYAITIFGSQSREEYQADEYSDLDVILIVDDPDYFLSSSQWLNNIGMFYISFIEETIYGGKERRITFEGAMDVDFVIFSKDNINQIFTSDEMTKWLRRGYHILVDKIGLTNIILSNNTVKQPFVLPTEYNFLNLVNDFWFHSIWTTKKLKRGELWVAKFCVDFYLKQKLLSIVEYHAHAINGIDYNTWHDGRFIEEWAEPWIIEKLSLCFSHYDKENIKTALLSTMDLFRLIAVEVAQKLDFQYPKEADEYATEWVKSILQL